MNEYILYTLAQVATTLAGFSGLVVVFRVRGAQAWSRAELRIFWFLLGDSFLVLFFFVAANPIGSCQLVPGRSLGPLQRAVRLLVYHRRRACVSWRA
jgi:hypothetical protein